MPGITAYLANKLLDHVFRNVPYTPPAIVYFKAHIGDPGPTGASAPSANTTRYPLTFSAAASGQIAITAFPEHTLNATETITHGSIWDHPTAGNCLLTGAATVAKGGVANDIIRLASDVITLGPLAT